MPQPSLLRRILATNVGQAIAFFARLVTAAYAEWRGVGPDHAAPRVYFANHASHGDFILIWSVLPPRDRPRLRPVAGADYWNRPGLRRFIGTDVFRALLIDRSGGATGDPVAQMATALDDGATLILFPEGTRNLTDAALLPFRSGLYHLAAARPETELIPVWISNLNRVLPKGEFVPVPLMCKVVFGAPLRLQEAETKTAFLDRARASLLALRPERTSA
ncbi:1-acyl-sn-glycerol-3-phosphate acyltransferase [Paracoccus suum]|uniref:1-acyl-sn-glycerol-3-phosphate acyltransferase n=1 Tax=Paracoccus suum TaxID=2259340 RepID=A0A344PGB1_9RHOB|nr:lysophospholipid acyltransferase family protein [Paracoccus suum]AXC48416.1 1-acyl-sn-glycerol-3-phosphate acyltransferase [Paracoccus suum]